MAFVSPKRIWLAPICPSIPLSLPVCVCVCVCVFMCACLCLFLSVGPFVVGLHLTNRGPVGPYLSIPFGPNFLPNFILSLSIIVKQPLEVHMPSMLSAFTSPKREPVGTYLSVYLLLQTFHPTNHSLHPSLLIEGVLSIQLIPSAQTCAFHDEESSLAFISPKRSHLVPATCVSVPLSVPTFHPTNHSGVLHLCQPISVPRVCQPITDLSCSDQSGSTLGKPRGFCCQASQRANTDGWQKKYRRGSGANTNSGQKKYKRGADSNGTRKNYISDQTPSWDLGQLPSK